MVIDKKIYKYFSDYIFKHSGILYTEADYYRLDSRIKTLQKELGFNSVDELYNAYVMKVEPRMHNLLIDLATNNETYFFRDNNKNLTFYSAKSLVEFSGTSVCTTLSGNFLM